MMTTLFRTRCPRTRAKPPEHRFYSTVTDVMRQQRSGTISMIAGNSPDADADKEKRMVDATASRHPIRKTPSALLEYDHGIMTMLIKEGRHENNGCGFV